MVCYAIHWVYALGIFKKNYNIENLVLYNDYFRIQSIQKMSSSAIKLGHTLYFYS